MVNRPITLLVGALLAFSAPLPAGAADSPAFGAFGLDLTTQDKSITPGDDFDRYAEGHWLESAKIPADRTRWGAFDELAVKAESDVREILEEAAGKVARREAALGTNTQKIADFYTAFLDTGRIDDRGLKPAQAGLDAIARAKTHEQGAALIAKPGWELEGAIGFYIV